MYGGHVRAGRSTVSKGAITIAVVVGVALGCGGIDDDELACEDALSHLEDCCPKFDIHRFQCANQSDCSTAVPTDLTQTASDCIRSHSCSDALSSGLCDRMMAVAAEPYPYQQQTKVEAAACK
jgi:hypothetical protein